MPNYGDPRANYFTLPGKGYEGGVYGWEPLAKGLKLRSGIVAVVPDAEPETAGSILLPEECASNRKPDIGTVVASADPAYEPGDRVIYAPWGGAWFRPFVGCGVKVKDLRLYGLLPSDEPEKWDTEPVEDVLPCKVHMKRLLPIKDKVLLKRDAVRHKSSGGLSLELPDDAKYRPLKATVVSAGPLAMVGDEPLKPGDRVVYNPGSLMLGLKSLGPVEGLDEDDMDAYGIVGAGNIFAKIDA